MGGQQFAVDARLEIETLQKGFGGQLQEVGKALPILRQQREVEAGIFLATTILLMAAARGDVGLVADDGVQPSRLGFGVKLKRPVEIAMVGDGQGIHPQFDRSPDQSLDRA